MTPLETPSETEKLRILFFPQKKTIMKLEISRMNDVLKLFSDKNNCVEDFMFCRFLFFNRLCCQQ